MKATTLCLSCVLILLVGGSVLAESSGKPSTPPKAKGKLNAQVFEKEDSTASFTAKPKVIREIQGETQVLFEGQQGFFILNMSSPSAGSWQNLLNASQTKKFKVNISYDPDSRQILGVSRSDE